ncbi:MAG: DUF502 domain-containing protein [Bacteroidales bacterium]|jgi:uncharacterized membrane protein|nr:DUF502 domain-containing protein [Bacteroidales bacterium]
MKIGILKRIRKFIQTAILGGIAAILPTALVIIVFQWFFKLVYRNLEPMTRYFPLNTDYQKVTVTILIAIAIIFLFFLGGLLVRSRIGMFFKRVLEQKYLMKIPGYKVARETVRQFFGKSQSFFSEVVLVDIFNSGTLMTGFITDRCDLYYTVFVPTGPNPTSGNIYHVRNDQVIHTTTKIENGMRTIISCGAGSKEIFKDRRDKKSN